MPQNCVDEPFQNSKYRGKPTEDEGYRMSSLADKLEKIDTCFWIVPSIVLLEITQPLGEWRWKGQTYLCVQQQNASWLVNEIAAKTAEAWNLVLGIVLFIFFLLRVPWVWALHNEYGLELLPPHLGGRGACGSLRIRSAKRALEAVVEFWHCVLDFHLPHFLQEVYRGAELGRRGVALSLTYKDLWLPKATSSALWTSSRAQGQRA